MTSPTDPPVFALLCPVCGGEVEKVGEQHTRSLFSCKECLCDVSVPSTAWDIARVKRQRKWPPKRVNLDPFSRAPLRSVASGRGTRD